jgi:transposase-like protein
MTKTQVEVTPSLRPPRRWSKAEKVRIVAAAMEPGAVWLAKPGFKRASCFAGASNCVVCRGLHR